MPPSIRPLPLALATVAVLSLQACTPLATLDTVVTRERKVGAAQSIDVEIVRDGGVTAAGFVSGMPAFGALLTPEEIRAVLEYIKTLWGPDERAAQARLSEADPYP